MRRAEFTFWRGLLITAALLLPCGVHAQSGSNGSRVAGHIAAVLPEDHVLREKQTLVATKDMVLLWRDVLKTESGGRLRIELSDGSVLNVGSDAQLRILEHDTQRQRTTLELVYGRLLADAVKIARHGGRFEVRTPVAVTGVVGTKFGLRVNAESTDVVCREGSVRVRNVDYGVGGEVVLKAGEFTHVASGAPPTRPAPVTAEQLRAGEDATAMPNPP